MQNDFTINLDSIGGAPGAYNFKSPDFKTENLLETPKLTKTEDDAFKKLLDNDPAKVKEGYKKLFPERKVENKNEVLETHNKLLHHLQSTGRANEIPRYLKTLESNQKPGDPSDVTDYKDDTGYKSIMQRYGLSQDELRTTDSKTFDISDSKRKETGEKLRANFETKATAANIKGDDLKKARQEYISKALVKFSPEDRANIASGFFDVSKNGPIEAQIDNKEALTKGLGKAGVKLNADNFEGDGLHQLDKDGKELSKAKIAAERKLQSFGKLSKESDIQDALNKLSPQEIEAMGGLEEVNKEINKKGFYAYSSLKRNAKEEPVDKKGKVTSTDKAAREFKAIDAKDGKGTPVKFTGDIGEILREGNYEEKKTILELKNDKIKNAVRQQIVESGQKDETAIGEKIRKAVDAKGTIDKEITDKKAELAKLQDLTKEAEVKKARSDQKLKELESQRVEREQKAIKKARTDILDTRKTQLNNIDDIIDAATSGEASGISIGGVKRQQEISFTSQDKEGETVEEKLSGANAKSRVKLFRENINLYLDQQVKDKAITKEEVPFLRQEAFNRFVNENESDIYSNGIIKAAVKKELTSPYGTTLSTEKSYKTGYSRQAEIKGNDKDVYNHKDVAPHVIADKELTIELLEASLNGASVNEDSNELEVFKSSHDLDIVSARKVAETYAEAAVKSGVDHSTYGAAQAVIVKELYANPGFKNLSTENKALAAEYAAKELMSRSGDTGALYKSMLESKELNTDIKAKKQADKTAQSELQALTDKSKDLATVIKDKKLALAKVTTRNQAISGAGGTNAIIQKALSAEYRASKLEAAGIEPNLDDNGNVVKYNPNKMSKRQIAKRQKAIEARNSRTDNPNYSDQELVELGENYSYAVVEKIESGMTFEEAYRETLSEIENLNPDQDDAEIGTSNHNGLSKRQTNIVLASMMVDRTAYADDLADYVNDNPGSLATMNRELGAKFGYITGRQHGKGWTSSDSLTLMGSGNTVLHSGNSVTHDLLEAARQGQLELLPENIDSGIKQSMVTFALNAEKKAALAQQKSQIYGQMFQGVTQSLQGMSGSVERLYAAKNGYNLNGVRYDRYS